MDKPSTKKNASRYLIIGTSLAIFNFGFYSILANLIINNSDLLWLSNLIATAVTTILAYILHSKITWKGPYSMAPINSTGDVNSVNSFLRSL